MAPTHVKLITKRSEKTYVEINLEDGDGLDVVKTQLAVALGIPTSDMKLRLCGRNQWVMIDKLTNIRVGSCGATYAVHEDVNVQLPDCFK